MSTYFLRLVESGPRTTKDWQIISNREKRHNNETQIDKKLLKKGDAAIVEGTNCSLHILHMYTIAMHPKCFHRQGSRNNKGIGNITIFHPTPKSVWVSIMHL